MLPKAFDEAQASESEKNQQAIHDQVEDYLATAYFPVKNSIVQAHLTNPSTHSYVDEDSPTRLVFRVVVTK